MPAPNAWNAAFPNDVILDVGVLTHEVAAVQTVVGMTRGGNNFVSGEVRRAIGTPDAPVDGVRTRIVGMTRILRWNDTRFEGTLIQLPFGIIQKFLPSTVVTAGTPAVSTYTPKAAGTVLALGDLLVKPTLTYGRGDGGTVAVQFDYGEVAAFPGITAPDQGEATFAYSILACMDPAAVGFTTNKAPYRIITTAAA